MLVKFNRENEYTCAVFLDSDHENRVKVIGLKCMNESKIKFLLKNDDISFIAFEDILAVLPNPTNLFAGIQVRCQFNWCVQCLMIQFFMKMQIFI